LIACINGSDAFYTTSSCSGRIALFLQQKTLHSNTQKGGEWLLVSHDEIKPDAMTTAIYAYKDRLLAKKQQTEQCLEMYLKF
jgi:tRNA wybutosine-synthesizing protein 3